MPSKIDDQPKTVVGAYSGSTYYVGGFHRSRTWTNSSPSWKTVCKLPEYSKPTNTYSDTSYRAVMGKSVRHVDNVSAYGNAGINFDVGYGPAFSNVQGLLDAFSDASLSLCTSESRLLNDALIRNLNKAADTSINLPVAVAEAGKTADLILGTARRLTKAYRQFRRLDIVGMSRTLGISPSTVHKTWLEYRYGWLPLLMDVKGAAEAFAKANYPRPPIFCVNTKSESVKADSILVNNDYGWSGNGIATVSRFSSSNRTVKVKIWYETVNSRFATAQQLGLTNPALVAWELVPFSFVFDWFISVGDWLTALTALQGLTIKRAFSSTLAGSVFTHTISERYYRNGLYSYNPFGTVTQGTRRIYTRNAITVSAADIYPPVNQDPLNWKRMITGVALLRAQAR